MSRVPGAGRLAASALPPLLFVAALLLGAPIATRALESRVGYVRWTPGPGTGLEHVGATRPLEVLLHLRNLGSTPQINGLDASVACAAGDVDRDGHGDLWVLSSLGPGDDVGGGVASLVSGRTRRVLRRMRQYDLRAANLSVANAGDVDGDGVDDLLLGQTLRSGTRLYWVRAGASGRLLLDVQRYRANMLAPVVNHALEDQRAGLAVGRTPRDVPLAWSVDLVDPATGASLGETELSPTWAALRVELGDLDGDGLAERGGWARSELLMDHVEVDWSQGAATRLVREPADRKRIRIDTAGDLDADGILDVLVEAPSAVDPAGAWRGELWVVSGASLVER